MHILSEQLMTGHAAPGGNVLRRTQVERDDLEDLSRRLAQPPSQLQHQIATAELAGIPFMVKIHGGTFVRENGPFGSTRQRVGRRRAALDTYCAELNQWVRGESSMTTPTFGRGSLWASGLQLQNGLPWLTVPTEALRFAIRIGRGSIVWRRFPRNESRCRNA